MAAEAGELINPPPARKIVKIVAVGIEILRVLVRLFRYRRLLTVNFIFIFILPRHCFVVLFGAALSG